MQHLKRTSHRLWGAVAGVMSGGVMTALGTGLVVNSPWLALGLPIALALVSAMLWSPVLAFCLTTLIIPIERLGRLTADDALYTISLMRIVGTFALGSYLLNALVKRQNIRFGWAFWIYGLYFILALLGLFQSTDMLGTTRACGAILGNWLFFMLVINVVRTPRLAQWGVGLWLVSTALICMFTIVMWHFGSGVAEGNIGDTESRFSAVLQDTSEWESLDTVARAAGPTSHSAVYAMNLILTLPFFLMFRKHAKRPLMQWALTFSVALVIYNIFLTNTRAAILLAAAVLLICGIKGMYRVTTAGLLAGMLAILIALPFVPDAIWNRVLDPKNYTSAQSATLRIRFEYWAAGLDIIGENPFSGIGVGNQLEVPKRLKDVGPEATTVHNEYIMTGMEVGVFGWLLFFGFVASMFWAASKVSQQANDIAEHGQLPKDFFLAIQIAMLATLAFGLQVDVFHFPLKGWWLIAGISWALYLNLKSSDKSTPHFYT